MTGAELLNRVETIQQRLASADSRVTILAPNFDTLQALARLNDTDWDKCIRILTTEQQLGQLRRDFITATKISDIESCGSVEMRTVVNESTAMQPLVITDSRATVVLLSGMESVPTLETSTDSVLNRIHEPVETLWASARGADIRTPAYSRILETVGKDFGESFETDVQTMLSTPLGSRAISDGLDEVHVFLLLAARHREQYRELTRWAERIRMGSPARVSSRKKELENAGAITTEKIERESVGRPRQRLVLADDRLQDASLETLVTAAQAVV